jgi:hypothetical protein
MNRINPLGTTLGILTAHIRFLNRSRAATKAMFGFNQSDIGSASY